MNHNKPNQGGTGSDSKQLVIGAIMLASTLVLSACGGGADNTPQQQASPNPITSNLPPPYLGPAPNSQDTLYFYKYLWNNLRTDNHCVSCHDVGGQGNLPFANTSDVNAAYNVVTSSSKPLVNLANPAASRLVTKFSVDGHYCLDGPNQVCATELTNWITAWANAGNGGSTTIQLTPPAMHEPAAPLNFPPANPNAPAGYDAVYNLVSTKCVGCHVPKPTQHDSPVSPEFAITQAMETTGGNAKADSYALVSSIPLINLADPTKSRLYTRLAVDGHNCWTDCPTAAAQMLAAIKSFTDPIQQAAQSGPSASQIYLASGAVNLFQDGVVASGGGRYEADQIALYTFKVGTGNTVLDVSGVSPAMNLTLGGAEGTDYDWMSNWGIQFNTKNAKAQALTSDSAKLQQMIGVLGQAYTIEAWVAPANTTQNMSSIVTYDGGGSSGINFSLNQNATSYEAVNHDNALLSATDELTATLQHVVLTYSPTSGRAIYINGNKTPVATDATTENLGNWGTDFALVLGNNLSNTMPWQGQIRMLAIHNAALTPDEVNQNFSAGVGQKYFLLFNISQHLGAACNPASGPSCFIMMEASVFDNYSYLFSKPTFINLNDGNLTTEPPVYLKNMRIGINGSISGNGQVFSGLDVCINGPCTQSTADTEDKAYVTGAGPGSGALLSSQGAVIAMQNGPKPSGGLSPDMIFLIFDQINGQSNTAYTVSSRLTPAIPAVNPKSGSDVLIHTFDEINASLSALTGIPSTDPAINNDSNSDVDCGGSAPCGITDGAFTSVIQALPSLHDPGTYNAASQMAVTQLAKAYCDALVGNTSVANAVFPNINFSAAPALDLLTTDSADQRKVVEPLLTRLMGVTYSGGNAVTVLSTMPSESGVRSDLEQLMHDMANDSTPGDCSTTCSNARTIQIIKATCTAAVSSAPMLLH